MDAVADSLWQLLTNPTVAYLLLITGVWAVVFAASIPGTGIPEGVAVVALALAAVGLMQLPVNLAGLGLILLALVLFVSEFRLMAHGALLAGGTLALAIGSLLLFRVESGAQAALSWVTVLIVVGMSTALFAFVIYKGLAVQNLPLSQDLNRVVGAAGVARTDVNGEGTVYAGGELWSASADDKIPAGSAVVILAREGLRLKVAKAPAHR